MTKFLGVNWNVVLYEKGVVTAVEFLSNIQHALSVDQTKNNLSVNQKRRSRISVDRYPLLTVVILNDRTNYATTNKLLDSTLMIYCIASEEICFFYSH